MTPGARVAAAIAVLDEIAAGRPAEPALIAWARASRFAGSGDRAAVRDLVFDTLRRRRSRAALGGGETGRALMLGALRETGTDPATIFSGEGHAPAPLSPAELGAGCAPSPAEALDLPDWIADRLATDLGPAFPGIAAAMRDRAPVWLRVNRLKADPKQAAEALARDGIETEPDPRLANALRVTAGERRVAGSAAYRDGLVELQDLSPQLACAALSVSKGTRVLDYCAGGGGKSLALAASGAEVTAWDAAPARMRDLPARARRAGAKVRIATRPEGQFDLVLIDVPCSGSGTWRRTPDAKWRLTEADLSALIELQARIMEQAARLVRPGGRLVYMTCSLFQAENGAQIEGFLARNGGFALDWAQGWSPLTASDGFFAASLSTLTSG